MRGRRGVEGAVGSVEGGDAKQGWEDGTQVRRQYGDGGCRRCSVNRDSERIRSTVWALSGQADCGMKRGWRSRDEFGMDEVKSRKSRKSRIAVMVVNG